MPCTDNPIAEVLALLGIVFLTVGVVVVLTVWLLASGHRSALDHEGGGSSPPPSDRR